MLRIGSGFDVHRLVPGRALVLGGVTIPSPVGLLGHSDADVLLHAVTDAVLGALAAGDIGHLFPDTDERFRGVASTELLRHVLHRTAARDWTLVNLDGTVIAERPRLQPHIPAMRRTLVDLFDADLSQVSVKATTTEGLGFTGRGEGIAAQAVVLLQGKGPLSTGT